MFTNLNEIVSSITNSSKHIQHTLVTRVMGDSPSRHNCWWPPTCQAHLWHAPRIGSRWAGEARNVSHLHFHHLATPMWPPGRQGVSCDAAACGTHARTLWRCRRLYQAPRARLGHWASHAARPPPPLPRASCDANAAGRPPAAAPRAGRQRQHARGGVRGHPCWPDTPGCTPWAYAGGTLRETQQNTHTYTR